jgi:alkanesulfonate monooxygenase SsuD/methylene tetrahydromethanopterin reductase-like flavin-dependent oxidoreductase (luciferase family)
MRFGILASAQYPFHEDLQQRLGELWDLTELAADLRYDSVFMISHFMGNLQTPQAISTTAKLIQHSGDMTVGTGILLLPLFHPVHIAEEFATLDHLAKGRLVLGVGAGYRDNEYRAFGLDKSHRFGRLREGIELLRALWTGEQVDYRGKHFAVEGEHIGIRPYQPGGPPIWIGAGAEGSVKRAARLGDAWFAPGNSPKPNWLQRAMEWHDTALADAGKTREGREYPLIVQLYCGETFEGARAEVRPYVQDSYFAYSEYSQLSWQRSAFEYLWDNVFLIGDPDHLERRIKELRATGFNHIVFRPFWTGMPAEMAHRSLRLFAEQVVPRFRAEEGAER